MFRGRLRKDEGILYHSKFHLLQFPGNDAGKTDFKLKLSSQTKNMEDRFNQFNPIEIRNVINYWLISIHMFVMIFWFL